MELTSLALASSSEIHCLDRLELSTSTSAMIFARNRILTSSATQHLVCATRPWYRCRQLNTTTPRTMPRTITATRHNVSVTLPDGLTEEQLLNFRPFNVRLLPRGREYSKANDTELDRQVAGVHPIAV